MDKNGRVEEEPSASCFENKEKEGTSTGISPLTESLFLSPPSSFGTNYSAGKLVRCTSTPSYSSLFSHGHLGFDLKDPLFTANIQLDQEEDEETNNVKDVQQIKNPDQDSVVGSYDDGRSLLSNNESDVSSTSSRGKYFKKLYNSAEFPFRGIQI